MPKDELKETAFLPEDEAEVTAATAVPEAPVEAPEVAEPQADAPEPVNHFYVSLAPQEDDEGNHVHDLEAPVHVSVPGLFTQPYPESDFVETDDGFERSDEDEQPKALLELDKHSRLVLKDERIEVPAEVAQNLTGIPYIKHELEVVE